MSEAVLAAPEPGRRIPTLDGWRAIAILLVLFDHIQYSFLRGYIRAWTQTGQHGVTIFFVLSGFLITSKLMEGPIDLKRFYLRRFFRLMPVAWAFLAFALLLNQVSANKVTSVPEVVSCLLFYRNFAGAVKGGLAGHFWSLSLEEQFYLVWPCVLLLSGFRRSRWIAAAGAIGCAGYRWLFWSYYDRNLFDNQSQVRADALLVGCLLALLLAVPRLRAASVRWSRVSAIPALLLLLFCVARFHWLAPLCECIAIAALIAASTLNPHSVFARPLTFAPFTALGIVSYSIYVWQQPFMMPWPTGLHLVLLCLVLPLFVLASYYGIERPCMRFGHRITNKSRPPASPVPA